jgi:glycosyltransferase involved in cell wall biosynthesis
MKIAMVTTVGERCGIGSYSACLADSLRLLRDTDVELVPITVGEQPAAHYEEQARALNAADVDVVHFQHEFSFWGFPMPGRRSAFAELRALVRKPCVVTAHTTLPLHAIFPMSRRNPIRWLRRKRLLANDDWRESVEVKTFDAAATIVHTDAARAEFARRGLDRERLFVLPMGIPAPLPARSGGEAFRDRYGLHGKRVLTLFGYVTGNKGYEVVIESLRHLPRDTVLVIAGGARRPVEQEYVDHLKRHVEDFRVADRVIVTGYLPDDEIAEAMAATDVALVPHTHATNSYSVAFPLTYGKPTLASNLTCFREIAAGSDALELFETGSRADFQRKLIALLDDAPRREQLAANALRHAERFGWPHVAETTREVYAKAIEWHRRS